MRGQRIKFIRQELGLEQIEFADKLGVSQSTLSRLERDDQKTFPIKILNKIESIFNVNKTFILTGVGPPFTKGDHKDVIYETTIEEEKTVLHRLLHMHEKKDRLVYQMLKDLEEKVKEDDLKNEISKITRFLKV